MSLTLPQIAAQLAEIRALPVHAQLERKARVEVLKCLHNALQAEVRDAALLAKARERGSDVHIVQRTRWLKEARDNVAFYEEQLALCAGVPAMQLAAE